MKTLRPAPALLLSWLSLTALLCTPVQAAAQWKWRDATGAIQYSDRPPPAGVPDSAILQRPFAPRPAAVAKPVADAESAASAPTAKPAPTQAESELDAKKRKAEEEKEAKRKADEEKAAKTRADNCARAKTYQKTLNDGVRIARTNAAGEREILDDKGRAEEMKRAQESISANCK